MRLCKSHRMVGLALLAQHSTRIRLGALAMCRDHLQVGIGRYWDIWAG
jgi:hypothetical protein